MAITDDLDTVAELCKTGAKSSLDAILALGPKPSDATQALLWEQQTTRLQGQLNSLSVLVSKLTAAAVIEGLGAFDDEMKQIATISEAAEEKIKEIKKISDLLIRLAKVLDLGLAILAAAAAPSPATIAAAVAAGEAVAGGV